MSDGLNDNVWEDDDIPVIHKYVEKVIVNDEYKEKYYDLKENYDKLKERVIEIAKMLGLNIVRENNQIQVDVLEFKNAINKIKKS